MKNPLDAGFSYLPAAFGAAGFGALVFSAVAGAVTVTLVFGATAGTGSTPTLVFGFVAGCVILFS